MNPAYIKLRRSTFRIDLNLVAEVAGLLTLAAIVAFYRHVSG
jgi:hypothetical protein